MMAFRTIKALIAAAAGGTAFAVGVVLVGLALLVLFVIPGGLELLLLKFVRARRWLRRARAWVLRTNSRTRQDPVC
jgi:hypothetical protein